MAKPEDHGSIDRRLQKLEENQTFTQRTEEQLHEQILDLGRRVGETGRRLERIEALLERLLRPRGEDDPTGPAGSSA